MPLTTPGKSSTDSLTKRVLIRWGNSTQPQHSDEQPDNQHKPPWLRLTAAVVCLSRGISFDPEPYDLNFQSFRVWVTLFYQWQPYLQARDPLRVRLNWVEVSENIPSKALFILVLDIQDCLFLCNLTREFDVRQSTQCFVPVEMYFEWSYSLKPPVTPFFVITLKLFQNRVHRRLPLRQSFEVSGHLRSGHLWAGSGHLCAGLIRLHWLSSSFKRVSSWPSSDSCLSWSQDFRSHLFRELIGAVPRLPSIRSCLANLSDAWAANRGGGLYFSTKLFHLFLASDSVREGFCRLRIP